jgi:hypothetical protein
MMFTINRFVQAQRQGTGRMQAEKWRLRLTTFCAGLFRLACGSQVPTSSCGAHSHPTADPSDTDLDIFVNLTIIIHLH